MKKFIKMAIAEAEKSYLQVKVGALLLHRNKVMAIGHNRIRRGFIDDNGSQHGLLCA